jgi:hypothetical protein
MEINDITYTINGAIFEVNKVLGPGMSVFLLAAFWIRLMKRAAINIRKFLLPQKILCFSMPGRAMCVNFKIRLPGQPSGPPAQP